MSAKKMGRIDSALEKALAEELKEITRKHTEGENKGQFAYNTMERMRVIDRCLKHQAIKLKANDETWGEAFSGGKED